MLSAKDFARPDVADRSIRAVFVILSVLSLAILAGCSAGWQPDPRDVHPMMTRPGIEGSDLSGPSMEDSRSHL